MIFIGEFCEMITNPKTEITVEAQFSKETFTTNAYLLRKSLNRALGFDFQVGVTIIVDDTAFAQLKTLAG